MTSTERRILTGEDTRFPSPQAAATSILSEYLVDSEGNITFPVNLYSITEAKGIKVNEAPLDEKVAGLIIQPAADAPVEVFLNNKDGQQRRRFTLAHEIGHYVKRKELDDQSLIGFIDYRNEVSGTGTDSEEIWANQFAAELLMPSFAVRTLWSEGYSIPRMARYFGTSRAATEIRIGSLGLA